MARLLIVEDDNDIRELLIEVLEMLGHQVWRAADGEEGLECLRQHLPDAVVLDVEMPKLDGPGMVARMQEHGGEWTKIPVILLSGAVDLSLVAKRVGTPYWLEKPTNVDALTKAVELALRERRAPHPALER